MTVQVDGRQGSFERMSTDMLKMMEAMVNRRFVSFRTDAAWEPAVNVYENSTHYSVCVDLAGVDHRSIDVRAKDGQLRIAGTREVPRPTESGQSCVHLMEVAHGPFCRQIELPQDVNVDGIEANYRQGLLWVYLPKR